MQHLSIGLERLDPFTFTLDCKENLPPTLAPKSHASNQPMQTPPSSGQENAIPALTGLQHPSGKANKKPLAFGTGSSMGQVLAVSMLAQQQPAAQLQQQSTPLSPLPCLSWTNSASLWQQMRHKDTCKPAPETDLHLRHPCILPSMRMILLDWMLEVCEEYRLHRETYYLALDMYDRFMDSQINIQKEQLQLVGVTCLFIASKIEEIYPPKLADFAYVTDGACLADEIIYTELIICKALNWRLNHHIVTVNTWMNIYMQLTSSYFRPPGLKAREFELPAYSPMEFIRAMQVLDLCTLDIASRQFCSSILSASALHLVSEKCQSHLHLITGFQLSDIHLCVKWMQPFVTVINRTGPSLQKSFKGVIPQDAHNIQTHEVLIQMLEEATELRKYQEYQMAPPLPVFMDCSLLMTPPKQERRCLAEINSTAV